MAKRQREHKVLFHIMEEVTHGSALFLMPLGKVRATDPIDAVVQAVTELRSTHTKHPTGEIKLMGTDGTCIPLAPSLFVGLETKKKRKKR